MNDIAKDNVLVQIEKQSRIALEGIIEEFSEELEVIEPEMYKEYLSGEITAIEFIHELNYSPRYIDEWW